MNYTKIIDDLIEDANKLMLTKQSKNSFFAELAGRYSPQDYVDEAKYSAWETRITTFLSTHFDEAIVAEYTKTFRAGSIEGGNTPSTVEKVEALLRTLRTQIENNEVMPKIRVASKDAELILLTIFNKFNRVARQLRTRHDNRSTIEIKDEYDVQDLLHAVLLIHFDVVLDEVWTPSYAGGSSRMDFLLKNEKIVIEVKKTRETMTSKVLGDQLIIDIEKYSEHPDCAKLLCFVYDPEGILGNPAAIMNDLNKRHEGFATVIIRPEM